ncbi:MAG TPA: hypothetical protein VF395_13660, partial [Polyangiaceae bacterium]
YSGTIGGKTTPCNSLSMGLNFNTKPGRLGDVFQVEPIEPKCTDINGVVLPSDPSNDSCSIDSKAGFGAGAAGGVTGAGGSTAAGGSGGTKLDAGTPDASDAGK